MSKTDDAQLAATHVQELLVLEEAPVKSLIARVAADYDVKPSAVEARLLRRFPSLKVLAEWGSQQRACQAEPRELKKAAHEWAQDVWRNCEPDGEPDWSYCCGRFLEHQGIDDERLRVAAYDAFRATGQNFNKARLSPRTRQYNHA